VKSQVNPVPPPDNGHIKWLRPMRVAHNRFDVQEYGLSLNGMTGWVTVAHLNRSAAREMCRENNLAYQEWYQRRARIAREIAAETARRAEARRMAEAHFGL
jgi:hypothetical protein